MNTTRRYLLSLSGALGPPTLAAACGIGRQASEQLPRRETGPATVNHLNATPTADPPIRWQQYLFDSWQKKKPQIAINNMLTPQAELATKLTTLLAAGTPPDTSALMPPMVMPSYSLKALAELDAYVKRDTKEVQIEDFFPGSISRLVKGGKRVAMPFQFSVETLAYSKPMFAAAGVKPPDESWTWDTFLDAARRLSKPEADLPVVGTTVPNYATIVWAWGGQILDASAKKCLRDEPAALAALQWWGDLKARYNVVPPAPDPEFRTQQDRFYVGRLGMFPGAPIPQFELATTAPPWDITIVPKGPAKRMTVAAGPSIGMFLPGKDPAWEWVKHYVSQDVMHFAAVETKMPVARKSAIEAQLKLPGTYNRKPLFDSGDFAQEPPFVPNQDAFQKAIDAMLASMSSGQKTAAQAVKEAKPTIEALLV